MRLRCIVTAGPTCEPLDDVRRLTNFSTGRLGSRLAAHLASQGHEVVLLRGEAATHSLPVEASITIRAWDRPASTAVKRSGSVRIRRSTSSPPSARIQIWLLPLVDIDANMISG